MKRTALEATFPFFLLNYFHGRVLFANQQNRENAVIGKHCKNAGNISRDTPLLIFILFR
jgi:hypothetical protein